MDEQIIISKDLLEEVYFFINSAKIACGEDVDPDNLESQLSNLLNK